MMNYPALRAAILTGPHATECAPYVILPTDPKVPGHIAREQDQAIADILNAAGAMTQRVSRPIGIGTILDVLGPTDGASVLDALEAAKASVPALKWGWHLLERAELDIGLDSTRAVITGLIGTGVTQTQADAILALADQPLTISGGDVSIALRATEEQ